MDFSIAGLLIFCWVKLRYSNPFFVCWEKNIIRQSIFVTAKKKLES